MHCCMKIPCDGGGATSSRTISSVTAAAIARLNALVIRIEVENCEKESQVGFQLMSYEM
jgi:hypothetical protein